MQFLQSNTMPWNIRRYLYTVPLRQSASLGHVWHVLSQHLPPGCPSLAFRKTRLRQKKWVNEGPNKGCTASHNGGPSPVALASPFDMSMGISSHVDSKKPSQY
ncbi:hypothetical protein AVEN_38247-1 [Araneus ventricosus]|uniref:Uncharacterized protein n=1 Tax=Araneus ventricosus TaxID=182803 RepID=A0A4Y2UWF7_ARAVE|nr:hypothetical protein AVEN_38247-1 [Araneus ventricosus]